MGTSVLRLALLLTVLYESNGQSTAREDSQCSYTFKIPASECGHVPTEDQLTQSLLVSLQSQFKFLADKHAQQFRTLVNENAKLREEIAVSQEKQSESLRNLTKENDILRQSIAAVESGVKHRESKLPVVNVKQCSSRSVTTRCNGVIATCDFTKKSGDTVLRVVWNGELRLWDRGSHFSSCRRYFLTINGNECSTPNRIDTQLHVANEHTDMVKPAYVEGYCRGIAAGDIRVAWNIGDCVNQNGHNEGGCLTGWRSTVRIIVEEVDVENADTAIV